MSTTIFKTLLLREWMQHRRGWLVLAALPLAVMLLVVSFGSMKVGDEGFGRDSVTAMAGMLGFGALVGTLALMWIAVLLQSPGLARRDVQDRSVEFWLSLPTTPAASIGATLLTHLLLVPWFALACGLLAAALIGPLVVMRAFGFSALLDVDWGLLAGTGVALSLRLAAGIALFTLWASPLILGLMAASAWLKRWGVPAVVGLLSVGGGLEKLVLGSEVVYSSIAWLFNEAAVALIGASHADGVSTGIVINQPKDLESALPMAVTWLAKDLQAALANLAHPGFIAAMVVGGVMFALLVIRRQRGA